MNEKTALEVQKQEVTNAQAMERTRECPCFIPRMDIYETDDSIVLLADIPGADENSVDITIEKNVLTISALVDQNPPEGYELTMAEYEVGDYQRSLRLPDLVERENIQATIKDGVLRLVLPKQQAARARKIQVIAG